jgi:hypothetical protein
MVRGVHDFGVRHTHLVTRADALTASLILLDWLGVLVRCERAKRLRRIEYSNATVIAFGAHHYGKHCCAAQNDRDDESIRAQYVRRIRYDLFSRPCDC